MRGLRTIITLFFALGLLSAATAAASSSTSSRAGSWRLLPKTPIPFTQGSGVWTGRQAIVFGRTSPNPPWSRDVAAAYTPATDSWRKLTPFRGDKGNYEGRYTALWSGREMLVFGPFDHQAFDPARNRWRHLPRSLPNEFGLGLVVWTGREAIAWGGGCCGDASAAGWAYDPATGKLRKLAPSPLAPSQGPAGAWTGHELIVVVSGLDPDGKPYAASFARAAAYDPATNHWHRLAPMPIRSTGRGVWNGHELLVVAAGKTARSAFGYDPKTNRWHRLASLPASRADAVVVRGGTRLFLVGGENRSGAKSLRDGIAYGAKTNSWTRLPTLPIGDLYGATAVWAGHELIVTNHGRAAAFTPAA